MLDNNQQKEKQVLRSVRSEDKDKEWKVLASSTAKNCKNYIRSIVDHLTLEPNPEKQVIALSIGKILFCFVIPRAFATSFLIRFLFFRLHCLH